MFTKNMNSLELMCTPSTPPRITVNKLVRWQVQSLVLMKKNSIIPVVSEKSLVDPDPENGLLPIPGLIERTRVCNHKIHLVYDNIGNTGKTTFLRAIKHNSPDDFIIFEGVPDRRDFITEIRARKRYGWTGHCIIFNIYRQFEGRDIHRTIEEAVDDEFCRNVWIFTTKMPKIYEVMSHHRWVIFKIQSDMNRGIISNLIPLSTEDAHKIYLQEQVILDQVRNRLKIQSSESSSEEN